MCNLLKNKWTSFQRYRPIHCKSRGKGKTMSLRPFQIFFQPFPILCMFISVWAHWKIESSYSPRKQKSHNLIQKAHSKFMSRLLSHSQWIQVLLFIILSVCKLSAWDWLRFFSFHGVTTMIRINLFCSIQSVQLILPMIISLILEQESNQTNKRWVRKHSLIIELKVQNLE